MLVIISRRFVSFSLLLLVLRAGRQWNNVTGPEVGSLPTPQQPGKNRDALKEDAYAITDVLRGRVVS
jgi:hypothetical protein